MSVVSSAVTSQDAALLLLLLWLSMVLNIIVRPVVPIQRISSLETDISVLSVPKPVELLFIFILRIVIVLGRTSFLDPDHGLAIVYLWQRTIVSFRNDLGICPDRGDDDRGRGDDDRGHRCLA